MEAGADVIYQAAFEHDGWVGYADFLFRVATPSRLGDWSYEVADAKLAHSVKPYHVLQLCFYSEQVARIQELPPAQMHVMLGNGRNESLPIADYAAYYRSVRARFIDELRSPPATYPVPCPHCSVCRWNDRCTAQRERDDHLSLVANISRGQIKRFKAAEIATMKTLASQTSPLRVKGIGDATAERLRSQAELQIYRRETGAHRYEILPPDGPHRGFALLPLPSAGDIFFDMEGNPFAEGGLEYLFGAITIDTGEPVFTDFWGHDRAAEKVAFEQFIDLVMQRLVRFPDLHIYHYASYEPDAMKRLMGLHATREEEVDSLLRHHRFVDLYSVVRNGVRVSQPGYSIKKLEPFYMNAR
ncbi:MAG TPA: TM0106 family RecB-like putative nuclease, partial [Burkholderiales bacterium]|nr:TM0106 family RecB-like putative nuclease [Burkholderiales bacterium]